VQGPIAPPGTYSVRLTLNGGEPQTQVLRVRKDPRSEATDADLQAQFKMLIAIRDKVTEANNAVRTVRNMRYQVGDRTGKLTGGQKQEFEQIAGQMMGSLTSSEEEIYQTKNQSSQDPLNYPIRLNNQIAALTGTVSSGDYRPTKQAIEAFGVLGKQLDVQLQAARKAMDDHLLRLNAILKAAGLEELKPSTDEIKPQKPNVAM
jgi:hypothetical protein